MTMAKELDLRDDGTAVIRSGATEWVLRRPTLGEYRQAFELFQAADDRLQAALSEIPAEDVTGRVKRANQLQLGENGTVPLYGQLIVDFIALLGGEGPSIPLAVDLPAWAVSSDASARLLRHWRAVPLDPGAPA